MTTQSHSARNPTTEMDAPRSHQALVYSSSEEFLEAAVPFVSDAVAVGDAVLVVTQPANMSPLRRALGMDAAHVDLVDSFDWPRTASRGRVAYADWSERHRVAGKSVRLLGEPMWGGLSILQMREWAQYDAALTHQFQRAEITTHAVCAYDRRVVPPFVIQDAERAHPGLLHDVQRRRSSAFEDPDSLAARFNAEPLPPPPETAMTLAFTADPGPVRRIIEDQGAARGLGDERLHDLVTAVNEIVTNVCEHGGGAGVLQCWFDPGELVCEVYDARGRLGEPWPGMFPPDLTGVGGRGLWLARQLSDAVEVRSGAQGTRIRLHLYVS